MAQHPHFLQQFAKSAIIEDATMIQARELADDLHIPAVPPETGSVLSVLARISGGKNIVEIGTGAGISSLWLLSGMGSSGVLTTIDKDHDVQQSARENFQRAGIDTSRARLINGWVEEVLPRLSDHSYDIVFIDALIIDVAKLLDESFRILRPGGSIVINGIGAGAEKAIGFTAEEKRFARRVFSIVAASEALLPAFFPVGSGLLAAVKDPLPEDK